MLRLLFLVSVAFVLSACVWSRLLEWQKQLKDFDRYVTSAVEGPDFILKFKEPCVRPADIGYLFGGEQPSGTRERAGGGVRVSWLLRRDRPDSIGLDVALGAADSGEKTLADSLIVPPQVRAFIPDDRLLAMARALGTAKVDRGKREATGELAGLAGKPLTPGRRVIVAAIGEPDSSAQVDGLDRLTYIYRLVQPDGSLGKVSELILDLKGEQLVGARLKAPNFNAWMDLSGK